MKELKINPRFEKFSPKKKQDEIDELRKSLKEKGYIGAPILTWHGYIIDGHNRYYMCKELGVEIDDDNIEEIDLGDDAEEIDAMDWMHTHQLSSKNLTAGEKLAMTMELQKEIALENEKKRKETEGRPRKENCTPIGVQNTDDNRSRSNTWTDSQTAKKAGVGVGTVARYNRVMNSDDENLKEKVKSGEVTVNKAYEEVRKKETRICKICGKEKKIIDFFGNDTICKECTRKEAEKNENSLHMMSSKPTVENMKIYEDVTTSRDAKDYIDQDSELIWLQRMCEDFIGQVNDRFFNLLCAIEKMDSEHIQKANNIFEEFVSEVFDTQEKFNNKKEN
jgi:hypothetical protein